MGPRNLDEWTHLRLDTLPRAARLIQTQIRSQTADERTAAQHHPLVFVNRTPQTSSSELGKHLAWSPSTVSQPVRMNLLDRVESKTDRRRVSLALTDEGRKTSRSKRQATEAYVQEKLDKFPGAELTTTREVMALLRQFLLEKESEDEE